MTPEQLRTYRAIRAADIHIHAADLDDIGDHTLTTGYNANSRLYVHVYVMGEDIHLLVHDGKRILRHEWSSALAAASLRPSKRAYPHTTNEAFAYLMKNAGEPLPFLGNFDWDQDWVRAEMAMEPFKAPTHLDF